jgi:hypothetical protein
MLSRVVLVADVLFTAESLYPQHRPLVPHVCPAPVCVPLILGTLRKPAEQPMRAPPGKAS